MKKRLQKKLYTFIVTAILFSINANAQIIYTDVHPDSTFACNGSQNCNHTYFLDVNNDGLVDFRINLGYYFRNFNIRWVNIIDSTGNAFAISTNGAKKFFMNDTIGPAQNWQVDSLAYLRRWSSHVNGSYAGEWIYETDKYLGLALNVSGLTYYGWVRLDVTVDQATGTCICIIKDYAYNSIPNQPILAGQTMTTGINENTSASSINLFPNPADSYLTIDLGSNHKKIQVTIADLAGKVIYTSIATDTQNVEVNTNDFAEGMYVVQIQTADGIETRTIIVE